MQADVWLYLSIGKCDYTLSFLFQIWFSIKSFVLCSVGEKSIAAAAAALYRIFQCAGKMQRRAPFHAPGSAFSANTMQHNEGVIVIARSFCCAFVVLLHAAENVP